MSHLNIYMDDLLVDKVKARAKMEKLSISKFICKRLAKSLETSSRWPDGYFSLFGSLPDSDLSRPDQIKFDKDVKREKI